MFREGVRSWDKAAGDPVTEADLALDRLLKERLCGAFPAYGWLSEETADNPERLSREKVWVVDPIDGTRDYARGRSGWAVSVALVAAGEPVLGALVAPARGLEFFAASGQGATLGGRPLRVEPCRSLDACRVPLDAGTKGALAARVTRVEKPNAVALRLAKLALGEADAVVRLTAVRELDIAAAALIAAEAGARVTDRLGRALRFNQPQPVFRGLAASSPELHEELVGELARVGFSHPGRAARQGA